MARLTFKEYLNEDELLTRPLRMVNLKKDPTDPTGKRLIKDVEAEKALARVFAIFPTSITKESLLSHKSVAINLLTYFYFVAC
jgi:hypothetical protein